MTGSPFLNSIRQDLRQKGYALKTEKTYVHWIKRFILFHQKRHPVTMGDEEVRLFLSYLANNHHVAVNTQKTALNALAFLYNQFLNKPLGELSFNPAKKYRRLPIVLSVTEIQRILQVLEERNRILFSLLYGGGLRINECLRLRVKDFDFDHGCISIHDGKGGKSRNTLLPLSLKPAIEQLIQEAITIQVSDNAQAIGPSMPFALDRKYPSAYRQSLRYPRSFLAEFQYTTRFIVFCGLLMLSKNQAKSLRALHRKKTRRELGLFLVEGEKVVAELLASNWQVESLYATPEFISAYQDLIKQSKVVVVECSATELTSVSTLVSNTAALAAVKIPKQEFKPLEASQSWVLVLDGINDPGNLGSLLRIADWYGIKQVVCSPTTTEVYNPKVITASKGSFLRVVVSYQPLDVFFGQLPANTAVLGAYLEGESIHQLKACPTGGVILLGSEARGISQELASKVTRKITIPAFGEAESLNVGIAAAVICDNLRRLTAK